jgi:uncharacterized protein (TIGR02996 family)
MRLYRTEKGQHVFWSAELAGKKLTTAAGAMFGSSKTSTKTYGTPAKAKAAHDELVAKHREQGYLVMGELPAPQVPIARDPAMEAELRRDREDPAPYLVYADWLQGQGSPLGEMLVLAQRKKMKQAEAIAKKIGLPDPDMAVVEWRHGLWRKLRFNNTVDHMTMAWEPAAFARALFSSPLCCALEELSIGMLRWEDQDDPDVLAEAGKHAWAKELPRLRVGDVEGDIDMNHHGIGTVGKIITKTFPKLTSLWMRGGQSYEGEKTLDWSGLALPELAELTIETCAMSRKRMKSIIAAKLPKIERLELWFGAQDRDGNATVADVAPVWNGHFPKLTHLGLCNTELVTDIVRLLPDSKIAAQLVSLDLSRGTFGDDNAAELAAGAKSFRALKTLNVSRSYLTPAGIRSLKAAFKGAKVVADDQSREYNPAEYGTARFVSVSE